MRNFEIDSEMTSSINRHQNHRVSRNQAIFNKYQPSVGIPNPHLSSLGHCLYQTTVHLSTISHVISLHRSLLAVKLYLSKNMSSKQHTVIVYACKCM